MGIVATTPNTRILVDGYDLTGFVNAGEATPIEQEIMDGRVFSSVGPRNVVGNYSHRHSYSTLGDFDAFQSDEFINSLTGDDNHYLGELWGANAEGSLAYESIVKLARAPLRAANGQLMIINTEFGGNGPLSRGHVLGNLTATGTTNRTGRNQGTTSSTQTYQAVIRVLSGTFTDFTFQIQQSSDDGAGDAYSLITGMTAVVSTVSSVVRVTFTGATEAWKRFAITAWSGTNAVVVATGGVVT